MGENNKFGHPSSITLERLNNLGCAVYRTDECGEITIKVTETKFKIKTMYSKK